MDVVNQWGMENIEGSDFKRFMVTGGSKVQTAGVIVLLIIELCTGDVLWFIVACEKFWTHDAHTFSGLPVFYIVCDEATSERSQLIAKITRRSAF